MFAPLFAADEFGTIVSLIVIVMGAIGWVINLISNQNQPKAPPPRRKPREEREPEEISMFLDATSPQPSRQPQKQNRKPQQQKPTPQQKPPRRESLQDQNRREASTRPGQELSQRGMQGSNLGGGIRARGAEMDQKVSKDVAAMAGQAPVAASVTQHLGTFAAGEAAARKASGESTEAAQVIIAALRNPAAIKQAILVNTLLSPPPGLRKR